MACCSGGVLMVAAALLGLGGLRAEPIFMCNFESECLQLKNSVYWKRTDAELLTRKNLDGPLHDHNYPGSKTGRFLYIGASQLDGIEVEVGEQPGLSYGPYCISVFIHLRGSLSITWTDGRKMTSWRGEVRGNGTDWHLHEFEMAFYPLKMQVFRAGTSAPTYFAMDDLRVDTGRGQCGQVSGPPPPPPDSPDLPIPTHSGDPECVMYAGQHEYQFQNEMGDGIIPWVHEDHSINGDYSAGTYCSVPASPQSRSEKKAWLMIFFSTQMTHCLILRYNIDSSARIRLLDGNNFNQLWYTTGDSWGWQYEKIDLSNDIRQIVIEGVRPAGHMGTIAVDDILIKPDSCIHDPTPEPEVELEGEPKGEPEPGAEPSSEPENQPPAQGPKQPNTLDTSDVQKWNFDNAHDLGVMGELSEYEENWVNIVDWKYDVKDWIVMYGPSESESTGPSYDHTTGTNYGGYLLFEASDGQPGDVACAVSPVLRGDGPHCIKFWYHMYGEDMGSLSLVTFPDKVPLWSISGNQGEDWNEAAVTIYEGVTKVMFEASKGLHYQSDIALDDILLHNGTCDSQASAKPSAIKPPVCRPNSKYCQKPPHEPYDLINWQFRLTGGPNNTIGHLDVKIGNGSWEAVCKDRFTDVEARVVAYTMWHEGPVEVLSYQDAKKIGVSDAEPGQTFLLDGLRCLSAWYPTINYCTYNEPGIHDCRHPADDVYLKLSSDSSVGAWESYFRKCEEKDGYSDSCEENPCVSHTSHCIPQPIALKLSQLGPSPISQVKFSCNFDMGGMGQGDNCPLADDKTGDDIDVSVGFGDTPTENTGPSRDHTTGLGYYLYLEPTLDEPDYENGNTSFPEGYCAVVISPFYTAETSHCLTFFYHMFGSNVGKILIFKETSTDLKLSKNILKITGDQGNMWHEEQVNITANPGGVMRVAIALIVGNGERGDIAIDDVMLTEGTCNQFP